MENLFGNRLSSARKMAGMSLQNLADAVENAISKQALNKYEKGVMKPDSSLLIKLSNALDVPVDYFFSKPKVSVEFSNPDYRKYSSKISQTEKKAIEEKAKNLLENYLEIEFLLNLKEEAQYFSYDHKVLTPDDAEDAAKSLRKEWELGYDPIPDVVAMLEDKGYKVLDIEASDSFDGLAVETNGTKVIVLNSNIYKGNKTRKRFTALHELAHQSLNIPDEINHKDAEKLCHVFASAVLYPEEMARKELQQNRFHFYEKELIILKERWGISISAIFHRALRLGIISDYVFRKINMGYKKRGYHKDEPGNFLSQERPLRFQRLVYFALGKELLTLNEAAYYTGMSLWEFRESNHQLV